MTFSVLRQCAFTANCYFSKPRNLGCWRFLPSKMLRLGGKLGIRPPHQSFKSPFAGVFLLREGLFPVFETVACEDFGKLTGAS